MSRGRGRGSFAAAAACLLLCAVAGLAGAAGPAHAHGLAPHGGATVDPFPQASLLRPGEATRRRLGSAGAAARPRAAAAVSGDVKVLATLPELRTAIAINFIGNTMLVSSVDGLYSYDVSDPGEPKRLGALPRYIFENEDMDVDPRRKLAFLSIDPRGIGGSTALPMGRVDIIDVSDPANLRQVSSVSLPTGHTTACVNDCAALWTGGPAKGAGQPDDWAGRPIYATDLTDPANPKVCPDPINTGSNDGVTDYSHDTFVDSKGVAWVSGAGSIRGFWTAGEHRDPVSGALRTASACKPVPYAGGGTPASATPSRFMHNAQRPPEIRLGGETGRVLLGTEENNTTDCTASGRFATYDLEGSFGGEGFAPATVKGFRLRVLDTFTPEGQPGSSGCDSAHWFSDRGDGILAYAFYTQGTRFLDVSDPTDIRQVGVYRPSDANTWAAYWHEGHVFVADFDRGVDILAFDAKPLSPRGGAEPGPAQGGPVGPGGAGSAGTGPCVDRTPPRSRLASARLTRRGLTLRGTARDTGCGGGRRAVARVQVAVARERAGRCAFLRASGRLGRRGPCGRPAFLAATGTADWRLRVRRSLHRGRYRIVVRATDASGVRERLRVAARRRVR